MAFDLTAWRAESQQLISDFARDPRGALARAGANTLYGMLLGSTILPVLAAYASDPKGALAALLGVAGGLGANLVANLVQQKYDAPNALAIVTQEAQQADLAPVYQKLAQELQIIALAEQALANAGQAEMLEQLRAELRQLGASGRTHNQTISGNAQVGAAIAGDVHGGLTIGPIDFSKTATAGDAVVGETIGGDTGPQHVRAQIERHTRRLRVLENQAAAFGYNVRPEVVNEIDDIRSEIARLEALLGE